MSKGDLLYICAGVIFVVFGSVGGITYLLDKHFPINNVEKVEEVCAAVF